MMFKKYFYLFRIPLTLNKFFKALQRSWSGHSVKEYFAWLRGDQTLSEGNKKLYSNVLPNLIGRYSPDVVVFDVGANDGWFARVVYRFVPKDTKVISFEPLKSMHPRLESLSEQYPNYRCEKYGLGDKKGQLEIVEYGTSGLSTLKGLSADYSYDAAHFDVSVKEQYSIEVSTLDHYFAEHPELKKVILKVDTQGFELEVLKGAAKAFQDGKFKAVIVEAMTIEKYKNSALYKEIFDFVHAFGFTLFDVHPSYYEANGMMSEFDCVFVQS